MGAALPNVRYTRAIDAVLLSFHSVQIPEGFGRIVDEQPYINVNVEFEVPISVPCAHPSRSHGLLSRRQITYIYNWVV